MSLMKPLSKLWLPNRCKDGGNHLWVPPWWKHNRHCLLCGKIDSLRVGKDSISMSPGGTDVLRWSGAQAATAMGDIGMDTATGRAKMYVAAADQEVAYVNELSSAPYDNRWNDSLASFRIAKKQGMTEEEYRDTDQVISFFDHNRDGSIQVEFQVPHDWDQDTEIRCHVHTIPMANGAGNVYFTYKFAFAGIGQSFPAAASWQSGNSTYAVVAADQYDHKLHTVFTYTPSGGTVSSVMMVEIGRDATNILDTYTTNKDHGTGVANLGATWTDVHYQKIRSGTVNEFGPT